MPAYYNEFDRQKAAWLRELIKRGVIAPGDVDERPIQCGAVGNLEDPNSLHTKQPPRQGAGPREAESARPHREPSGPSAPLRPGQVNGFWRDADWILCRDGKWRAVEPGSFPLAHGSAARVGRLRGYGDGIVAQAAAEFIKAYLATEKEIAPWLN